MSLPIPYHLRGIAEETACTKDTLTLQLRCPCGCTLFRIFQNTLTDAEQAQLQPYQDALAAITSGGYPDFAGMADYMKRGYLRDFHLPEKPAFADLKRITVQCTACDAASVIFDSRYHGYDGAVCGTEIPPDYEPQMVQVHFACTVRIQLSCTVAPAEFIEITDGMPFTEALFSECFTQIDIAACDRDGVLHPVL
jgi:hypothetical protein